MSSVAFKDVWKIYGGDIVAVREASFRCEDGQFIAILGPSGCGKSSSLRMIAGLEEVSQGEILFDDKVVNDLSSKERNIALAFESYALYSPLSIYENIAFPLRVRGTSKGEIKTKVSQIANALELEDVLDRKPAALSGGQKQRVSLARALVRNPNVFLLDEPLSHMDQSVRSTLRARIRHIHDELKATTIYVTHDQEEAVALADSIIVMNMGTIQQVGSVHEIYESPSNRFVAGFVGDPEMNFLEGELEGESRVAVRGNDGVASWDLPGPADGVSGGKEVTVGVRPEKVHLSHEPGGSGVKAQLDLVEFVGDYKLLTFRVAEQSVKALTPISFSVKGAEALWLSAEPGQIHVFDRASGEAVVNRT
jgi:multiple sugar transport system ATP-binding protein